jgi:hypothetical protein
MSASLHLSGEALRDVAQAHGVCVRPIVHEVVDTETGRRHLVPTPCGATRASKCPPCAEKARRLRMQQCREGWHLADEPVRPGQDEPEASAQETANEERSARRVRSTRRRQDALDLPRLPVEDRTVGRTFTAPSGRTFRPSMFATFTLPSYGRVHQDGTPVDPASYDYRRAALDALHFPRLVDRLWQNLRRAVGFKVQYFAAVEPQRRLAPHLHAAVRGAIPRALFRDVVSATYHQVWWPAFDTVKYDGDHLPVWSDALGFVDPNTGSALPTWTEALDRADAEGGEAAHVMRFGRQLNLQGILASQGDADRRVAYLTKYLAKGFADAYADPAVASRRQRGHLRRLHQEVRWLPCSSHCWNWLRYGVQPEHAERGTVPGSCPAKSHDVEQMGFGGRRVLVSRLWTGKTLEGHRADRAEVVRQVLLAAGVDKPEVDRLSVQATKADGTQRFEWRIHNPLDSTEPIYRYVMTRAIHERMRWQAEYQAAKARGSPRTRSPVLPTTSPHLVGVVPVKGERSESRSDTTCP